MKSQLDSQQNPADAIHSLINNVYEAFNRREMDTVLAFMHPEVHWPNGWEGGFVNGHSGVRDYWTRQWKEIDPEVRPLRINQLSDGRVEVEVRQIVKDLEGAVLLDGSVRHVYTLEDGLIKSMEIMDRTHIRHISAGWLSRPAAPRIPCHCLLLEDKMGLALVDTGIGLQDVLNPVARIGESLIAMSGFQFKEESTALRQIESLGYAAAQVKHIILTHGDPDHVGGLADFPMADIHVSGKEHENILSGNPRFSAAQFAHGPKWNVHGTVTMDWYGLEAVNIPIGFDSEIFFIPLPGHTNGHCGVAIRQGNRWLLHVGDAYYLKAETQIDNHPVTQLATLRAENNEQRARSLEQIKRLMRDHSDEISFTGYHDIGEFLAFVPEAA